MSKTGCYASGVKVKGIEHVNVVSNLNSSCNHYIYFHVNTNWRGGNVSLSARVYYRKRLYFIHTFQSNFACNHVAYQSLKKYSVFLKNS